MNSATGNSSSGHPQHRGGDDLTVEQKDLKLLFYYPTRTIETRLTYTSHDL